MNAGDKDGVERSPDTEGRKPLNLIVIGMAGSGKTTFIQRLYSHLKIKKKVAYMINLDPAVTQKRVLANIDIRDTVDYKAVMKEYNLGPNGGILTSLNLFTTKFDKVLELIDKKSKQLDYVIMDTPGQIEIFTWSASGAIITEAMGVSNPTVILYVIDTPRTTSAITFMSNMLYACSILYKTQLPFILVFNKTDVVSHEFALNWMNDFEAFQEELSTDNTYMATFTGSLCLVLDEFYNNLNSVGVSSVTGDGMDDLLKTLDKAYVEYMEFFKSTIDKRVEEKKIIKEKEKRANLEALMKDMNLKEYPRK